MEGRFRLIVDLLREKFGYIPRQHTVIDNVTAENPNPDIDTTNDKKKGKRGKKSGVEGYEHEFDKVSCIEKIIREDEIYKKKMDVIGRILVSKSLEDLTVLEDNVKQKDALYCIRESVGANATGIVVKNGFMIFAGSKFRKDETKSIFPHLKSQREDMVKRGILIPDDSSLVLQEDIIIESISKASGIILSCASNGNTDWKDINGKKYGDILKEKS